METEPDTIEAATGFAAARYDNSDLDSIEGCDTPGTPMSSDGTGTLIVLAKKLAVCWDTGPDGVDAEDHPIEGAEIEIRPSEGGPVKSAVTGSDPLGEARFVNLEAGEYTIRANYTNDEGHAHDNPIAPVTVSVSEGATAKAEITIKRQNLDCKRKHPVYPEGASGPEIPLPVFWIPWSEPAVLVVRDGFWLVFAVFTVLSLAVWQSVEQFAFWGAFHGLFALVIFGTGPGLFFIGISLVAFAGSIVLLATAGLDYALASRDSNVVFFIFTSVTWAAFAPIYFSGKQSFYGVYKAEMKWLRILWIPATIALVVSAVLLILIPSTVGIGIAVLVAVISIVIGCISWLGGYLFANEGQTGATHFKRGFALPYAGERFCVQGMHGFISHYVMHWGQEYSYDFAVPKGEPVLSATEGHIIRYRDSFSEADGKENLVSVMNKDHSVTRYLHGRKGGVQSVNPAGVLPGYTTTPSRTLNGLDYQENLCNPVYIQQGTILHLAGNTGNSMFSHIHIDVFKDVAGATGRSITDYVPFHFDDEDVQRHGGRCFNQRKYRSDNKNKGGVILGPDVPEVANYP